MGSDARSSIHELIKRYKIHFDRTDETRWPQHLSKTFSNIKQLGRMEFEAYCQNITIESDQMPWRAGTKTRAKRIADLAIRTLNENKREIGWRFNLEHEVLARFTVEVNCPVCRARLWRSELEADVCAIEPGEFAQILEARRRKRAPCICRDSRRSNDPFEQGLNPLFGDRSDECIDYESPLAETLKKGKRPDRIYGLRETKILNTLLSETKDESGTYLEDRVRCTPFKNADPEPLLFPFLVLEAKSEKGRDPFSAIEAQTVFAIRALLQLQNDLRNAAQEYRRRDNEPLVWFLANKGEQWRVAAAHVEETSESQHYHICDLWSGRICDKDGALQLVLIVDYIFDWARDIYRDTIIDQLRSLASVDAPSLADDSDIFSTFGPVSTWMAGHNEQGIPELDEAGDFDTSETRTTPCGILTILKEFDCESGVFRDARCFHTRFHGIHLSRNALKEFLGSETTVAKAQKLARIILGFLKDAIRVDEATLGALERLWTKNESPTIDPSGRTPTFVVKVYFAAYLTSSWEQTFDLVYFALEESAIEDLQKYANPNNHKSIAKRWHLYPGDLPLLSQDDFLQFAEQLRHHSSRRDMLLAAIEKRSLTMHCEYVDTVNSSLHQGIHGLEFTTVPKVTLSMDPEAQGIRNVLSYYNRFRIGMNQPSQNFLRHSSCDDEQNSKRTATQFWHECVGEDPGDIIPAYQNVLGLSSRPDSVCLYLVDGIGDLTPFALKMDLLEQCDTSLQNTNSPKWDDWWNLRSRKSASQFFESKLESLVVEATAKCSQVQAQASKALSKERSSSELDPVRPSATLNFLQQLSVPNERTGIRDSEDSLGPTDDARLKHIPKVLTQSEASKTLEIEDNSQALEASAFRDIADHNLSLQDAENSLRLRLLVCKLIQEVDCLTRMRRTARDSARDSEQETPSLSPRSRRSNSDTSKRPIDLTGDDDDDPVGMQGPAKRLSIRDLFGVIEGDRLGDMELEALIRDGYFAVLPDAGEEKEEPFIEEDRPALP